MSFYQHHLDRFRAWNSRYSRKRKLTIAAGLVCFLAVIIPVGTYAYYAHDIANPDRLMNHNNTGIVLLDRNGEVFYSRGVSKGGDEVKLSAISPITTKALLASEDKNFYTEPGFSVAGIGRALFSNFSKGSLTGSGGSTLTQQLVKNNLLTSHKSLLRKYQELSMAVAIDRKYSKDQILEMYLNSVYFGSDAFGIEAASKTYFGKPAKDLDLAESSMLVGILPAPSVYSPTLGDPSLAKKRQNYVLTRMVQDKYISTAEKSAALQEKLNYKPVESALTGHAQHFALMVLAELDKRYGEEKIARSGFRVTTTLDLKQQEHAEAAVASQIEYLSRYSASNAAVTAIEPRTGEVRALVGSVNWDNKQFGKVNMALAPRQPGSSFKPIYYTEAFAEQKITAATILEDKPTDFGGGYRPTNYDLSYHGNVTVRDALANSWNIPAVEVMQKVGISSTVQTAQRLGIKTVNNPDKYGLSLALGTAEARLLDMTNAYAAFADQGEQYKPVIVKEVKNKFGESIYRYKPSKDRVMSKEASYIISSILSDDKARFPLVGSQLSIGRPAAVKTGTTNDNKDAWTIGYTPGIAVGVWVGNNDSSPMQGIAGARGAGPIWRSVITSFTKGTPIEHFSQPDSVIKIQVCSVTKGTYDEYFIKGTEDNFKCSRPVSAPAPEPVKKEENTPTTDNKKTDTTTDTPSTTTTTPATSSPNSNSTTPPPSGTSNSSGGTTPPPSTTDSQPAPSGGTTPTNP